MNKWSIDAENAIRELIKKADLKSGQIVVVGCSTSEIIGQSIGSDSNYQVAEEVFLQIKHILDEEHIFLAAQCCEHLNRAIVIERECLKDQDIVNAVPQPKAGGSFATAAYRNFKDPVLVEEIKADAGLDIGNTLIGMHLKKVAVPLRLETKKIGEASLNAARTRAKFIGGVRAVYDEGLL